MYDFNTTQGMRTWPANADQTRLPIFPLIFRQSRSLAAMTEDASSSLIDARVSLEQCRKAADALLSHARKHQAEKDESSLLPGNEVFIWLQIAVKKVHATHSLKPHRMFALLLPLLLSHWVLITATW